MTAMLQMPDLERRSIVGTRLVVVLAGVLLAACQPPAQPTIPPTPPAPGTPRETSSPTLGPRSPSREPGSPSPPATRNTSPSPTLGGGDGAWIYLADFPAEQAIEVASVTAWGGGFAAVGSEPAPDEGFGGRRNGVVWTSADGRNWTRSLPSALGNATLTNVVLHGDSLFAFGEYSICPEFSEDDDCLDAPDAGVALWRSADAVDWQRLAVPASLQAGILDGVVLGLGRLIAFGSTGEELVGALWLSADGQSWEELRELGGVDPLSAVGAGPDRLVGFGTRYLPEEDDVETLAGYSTGGGFAPAQLPAGQRGVIQAVLWSGTSYLAVGVEYEPAGEGLAPLALTSADGSSWTAAASGDMPTNADFQQLLVLPSGYLVIGSVPSEEFGRELAYSWFSADGLVWQEHAALSGGAYRQLGGSALGERGVVVFATDFEESEEEPGTPVGGSIHAWFAPPESLP